MLTRQFQLTLQFFSIYQQTFSKSPCSYFISIKKIQLTLSNLVLIKNNTSKNVNTINYLQFLIESKCKVQTLSKLIQKFETKISHQCFLPPIFNDTPKNNKIYQQHFKQKRYKSLNCVLPIKKVRNNQKNYSLKEILAYFLKNF